MRAVGRAGPIWTVQGFAQLSGAIASRFARVAAAARLLCPFLPLSRRADVAAHPRVVPSFSREPP